MKYFFTKIAYKLQYLFPGRQFLILILLFFPLTLNAQVRDILPDSTLSLPDTAEYLPRADSLPPVADTLITETTSGNLEAPVDYHSVDSMDIDMTERKVYLYGDAVVTYMDIELKADYIELDMDKKEVYASGLPDSTGKIAGKPVFREGSETFESEILHYNFDTKRGFIREVITEQEGGYLHSTLTKRHEDGTIHLMNGKYTTCDAPEPHFYVALTKAKVLPKNKIVSGPAYLVIADIPLPVALPFGFFPNKQEQASGILIPEYGEEVNRGFFLRNGGYYFALSDYFDLRITGDIYSKGTWGLRVGSNYVKRYRFRGNLNLQYFNNITGDKLLGNQSRNRDYSITWSHSQDAKANPNSSFSASVNMSSSSFDRNHSYETEKYLTNQKSSSISFSKRWPGTPFNFSGSLNHNQNSRTKSVDLSLPRMAFNMSRIYPFKRKNPTGETRWYENIELSYSAKLDNQIKTTDSLMFTSAMFRDMRNGFQHSIPISTVIRPFRNFSISPNVQYTGVLYTQSIKKRWEADYYDAELDSTYGRVMVDTIPGLRYAHAYSPSISATLNPKIFGMYQFKNPDFPVRAIRHVMTPSVSFNYTPDMSSVTPDYYDTVQVNAEGTRQEVYSYFEGALYRAPSIRGKQGSLNFSLNNNLEMKVRSRNDTASEDRKIKILESLNFGTSYNIFADSMRWNTVSMSGRTSLFNKINITFGGSFDPYALDENGSRINRFYFQETGKLLRLTRFNLSLDMSLNSAAKGSSSGETDRQGVSPDGTGELLREDMSVVKKERTMQTPDMYQEYVDFNVPWNFNVRYNLNLSRPRPDQQTVTQTLSFSGNISLTPKWKISLSSGYDFEGKKLSYTSVNIHRDLHCWEMRISFIPIGYRRSYTFQINVLSSVLRDLKYEKRQSWYDNPYAY